MVVWEKCDGGLSYGGDGRGSWVYEIIDRVC